MPVTVPFAFVLWNYLGTAAWVSSNGTFGAGPNPSSAYYPTCPLPDLGASAPNSVAAFQDDLYTRATGVCVATVGTSPNRKFVVTWADEHFCCGEDPTVHLTFSLLLSEGTNTVDLVYRTMMGGTRASGDSAAVGIINGDRTRAIQYSCDQTLITSGTSIRFTPQ